MLDIYADVKKNQLYLTLDNINEMDLPEFIKYISKEVEKLAPGFTCLVDIRNLRVSFSQKESEYINTVQGALKKNGMSKVVRVIGIESFNKFTHDKMNEQSKTLGYEAVSVATLREAEKILNNLK